MELNGDKLQSIHLLQSFAFLYLHHSKDCVMMLSAIFAGFVFSLLKTLLFLALQIFQNVQYEMRLMTAFFLGLFPHSAAWSRCSSMFWHFFAGISHHLKIHSLTPSVILHVENRWSTVSCSVSHKAHKSVWTDIPLAIRFVLTGILLCAALHMKQRTFNGTVFDQSISTPWLGTAVASIDLRSVLTVCERVLGYYPTLWCQKIYFVFSFIGIL